MSAETFQISGRPTVRSLLTAAGISILGVVLLIVAATQPQAGAMVINSGLICIALGAGLLLLAQDAARRGTVTAIVDGDGLTVRGGKNPVQMAWADIKHVASAGNSLIIRDAHGHELTLAAPLGSRPGCLDALGAALAKRLDADRGYQPFV